MKYLRLNLDDFNSEYIYTHYATDGGCANVVVIKYSDKHNFIEEYLRRVREKLNFELEEIESENRGNDK